MSAKKKPKKIDRRQFLKTCCRLGSFAAIGGITGLVFAKSSYTDMVWQIDPEVCKQCGRCATECVLTPSAVKCVHAFAICGYCDLCSGYFKPGTTNLTTGGENQLCPTSAIKRTYIEDPFYEYVIDETLCIGCALCVTGCGSFGNGSLFLQVRHDRCLNCNSCSIERVCPSGAFKRVPSSEPYLIKKIDSERTDV